MPTGGIQGGFKLKIDNNDDDKAQSVPKKRLARPTLGKDQPKHNRKDFKLESC